MSVKNYSKTISALKKRFGNHDLLIEVYVRELVKLIVTNVKTGSSEKLPLPQLFDKIEAQLRALESLDIKTENNACWLYSMVESCLSEEVLRAWLRSPLFGEIKESQNISRLTNLMKFLRCEVEGEERLQLMRSGFEILGQKDKYSNKSKRELKSKFKSKQLTNVPTAAGFLTTKDNNCIFCDKLHDSKDCFEARSLSLDEKKNKIRLKRCCLKCLSPGHIAKSCKQFVCCYVCVKAHTISLCSDLQIQETQEKATEPDTVQATTAG
ncbi:uncharacterized protein LOC118203787 [Stegodyphus dumicola]|uniref:uncharacterized protein LOC118203787 n=1 Tax=Stegodyphus dumicola TaxID=202533 RepID=UPI0015AAF62A|nr:uncharacterized protein LOC118203787 [Stegodyphus dumicola]